jgi:DNA-binding NtrC family response regulator
MKPTKVLVLGPEGAGRAALQQTLSRLGYAVSASEARRDAAAADADILMLDLRGDDADWADLAPGIHDDDRPVMIVSERPRPIVRELAGRQAGTMLLTGGESDAGYRVALSVLRALRETAQARAADRTRKGAAARVAAL